MRNHNEILYFKASEEMVTMVIYFRLSINVASREKRQDRSLLVINCGLVYNDNVCLVLAR